jgi:hypothetical protein
MHGHGEKAEIINQNQIPVGMDVVFLSRCGSPSGRV